MNRIYCSDNNSVLYDIAKDIAISRDVCLVVPSSEYICRAVTALRSTFEGFAKVVDVHETQDSATIKAEHTDSFGTDVFTASVYTMNALPTHEKSESRRSYCGVYFYNASECLKQYITNKGYTEICSIVDIFANDPVK